MSLEYAILGFLNYHPYTGYDLKKIFDTSIRHFWPADQSQIYRTLARLTEQGFAEMEKVPQDDRPDRKVYSITEAGRAELMKWLSGPPPIGRSTQRPAHPGFLCRAVVGRRDPGQVRRFCRHPAGHPGAIRPDPGPDRSVTSRRSARRASTSSGC